MRDSMTSQDQADNAAPRPGEHDEREDASFDLGFGESLAFTDIQQWQSALRGADEAIQALRNAQSDAHLAEARGQVIEAFARARDFETAAIHVMSRYGYADGVRAPGMGLVRINYIDDTLKMLEIVPDGAEEPPGSAVDGPARSSG